MTQETGFTKPAISKEVKDQLFQRDFKPNTKISRTNLHVKDFIPKMCKKFWPRFSALINCYRSTDFNNIDLDLCVCVRTGKLRLCAQRSWLHTCQLNLHMQMQFACTDSNFLCMTKCMCKNLTMPNCSRGFKGGF